MNWDIQNLFRLHAGTIARRLRRRGLSADTAADLTQDTFLRVLISPPGETAGLHNPEAYLHRIARNLRIDHLRRERLSRDLILTDADFARILDPAPSAETVIHSRERLALVAKALAELPDRQQRAFLLHRLEGMTMASVAAHLGVSTSTAWGLIRDAYDHVDMRLSGV